MPFRILILALSVSAILSIAGCGGESRPATAAATSGDPSAKPTPGSYHTGGGFAAFYGEELFDKRIYLFGQKPAWEKFVATHEFEATKVKTYINAGPNHETVIVQTDKDAPQMTKRVYEQFQARYSVR